MKIRDFNENNVGHILETTKLEMPLTRIILKPHVEQYVYIYIVLAYFWQMFIDFPEIWFLFPQFWHVLKTGDGKRPALEGASLHGRHGLSAEDGGLSVQDFWGRLWVKKPDFCWISIDFGCFCLGLDRPDV